MKKIIFILIVLVSASTVIAQGYGRSKGQRADRQRMYNNQNCVNYIDSDLKKQQEEFYSLLSEKDKAKVENLKSKLSELQKSNSDNDVESMRLFKDEMYRIRKEAEKIADKYPDQSKKYGDYVVDYQNNCRNNNQKMGRGNRSGGGKGRNNQKNCMTSPRMNMMKDAAWLLLWDENNPRPMMGGMRQQANCTNKGMGMRAVPELSDEAKAYIDENIFPAMAEKRKSFDNKLSESEKKDIETARGLLKTRNAMRKAWMESEDFVPGQRRDDPDFDAFRDQMQKSMQAVRVIAIQHSDEIETALSELDDQRSQWKSDMPNLMSNAGKPGRGRRMGRNSEEMRFLLLNPEDKESFGIF